MPRQRSLVTVIRDMVQREVGSAIQSLLGSISTGKRKATNGRRRRRRKARGKWRPGGPGRPPKAVAEKMAQKKAAPVSPKPKTGRRRRRRRRGPRRPAGSKKQAAETPHGKGRRTRRALGDQHPEGASPSPEDILRYARHRG